MLALDKSVKAKEKLIVEKGQELDNIKFIVHNLRTEIHLQMLE